MKDNIDKEMREKWKPTEIHIAAYNCNLDYLKERIAARDDVNLKDNQGFAPLHWCALRGMVGDNQHEIAKTLIDNGANPNAITDEGMSVLEWAITSGNQLLIEVLINNGADVNLVSDDVTPLMAAAKKGNVQIVELLIKHGADVKKKIGNFTAVHYADHYGNDEIVELLFGVD